MRWLLWRRVPAWRFESADCQIEGNHCTLAEFLEIVRAVRR